MGGSVAGSLEVNPDGAGVVLETDYVETVRGRVGGLSEEASKSARRE